MLTIHPPSSTEVEGRVELYICSPSGPSWPVIGWPLPFTFTLSVSKGWTRRVMVWFHYDARVRNKTRIMLKFWPIASHGHNPRIHNIVYIFHVTLHALYKPMYLCHNRTSRLICCNFVTFFIIIYHTTVLTSTSRLGIYSLCVLTDPSNSARSTVRSHH